MGFMNQTDVRITILQEAREFSRLHQEGSALGYWREPYRTIAIDLINSGLVLGSTNGGNPAVFGIGEKGLKALEQPRVVEAREPKPSHTGKYVLSLVIWAVVVLNVVLIWKLLF